MPTSDFLPFATHAGANVVSQPNFVADPATGVGFSSGIALSAKLNKVWRQSSFVSAAIAKLMLDNLETDIIDDGDLDGFVSKLRSSIVAMQPRTIIQPGTVTQFYVNSTTGSDSYSGLSPSTPWQTLQHAADTLVTEYDFNGQVVTVNVANGTYQGFYVGQAPIGLTSAFNWVWNGNVSNPQACVINATGNFGVLMYDGWCLVQGFRIIATQVNNFGGVALLANGPTTIIIFKNIDFGPCTVGHWQCSGGYGGPVGNYQISGGAQFHVVSMNGGSFNCPPASLNEAPLTVTIINNPNFSGAFALAGNTGTIVIFPSHMSFTGTCTGARYAANNNSTIYTPNADIAFFPGSVAGYPAPTAPGVAPNLTLPGWNTFSLYAGTFVSTTIGSRNLSQFRVYPDDPSEDLKTAEQWTEIAAQQADEANRTA